MRNTIALLTAAALLAGVANAKTGRERRVVYLNGPEAMAELQKTNPRHYEIATKILAAGPQLCEASGQRVYQATLGAEDATYIALVVVKGAEASVVPAK